MGRALTVAMIVFVAGCYQSPSLSSCKYRCGGANNDSCPSGYSCHAGMCVAPGESCDGDGGVIDANPDADLDAVDAPIDAMVCANPGAFMWVKQTSVTTMPGLTQVVAFDGNNDGKMDLAVLDEADKLGFFPGMGDGSFGARIPTTVGANARKIIAGDFDRDSARDDLIALQGVPTPTLAVLESNGNGTFARTPITLSPDGPIDVANAGDLDGNMYEDVIVLYSLNAPRIAAWLQDVTWMAGPSQPTDSNAKSLVVGQANEGAVPDVVVTVPSEDQFGIHVGTLSKQGQELDWDTLVSWNVNMNPVDAVIGNLRSGEAPSVVTANSVASTVSIRHNLAVATFNDGGNKTVGGSPRAVILADVGGSSLLDIVTADNMTNTISVLINEDGGAFANVALTNVDTGPVDLVSADFDNDGRMDLAVATPGSSTVSILLNKCPP